MRNGTDLLLRLENVSAGYGHLQIVRDVSVEIGKGEFVCLIGPNGAGKSTLLKTVAGVVKPTRGSIVFDECHCIEEMKEYQVNRVGISYVSEELNLFRRMSVLENLEMGAQATKDKKTMETVLEFVLDVFPRLKFRLRQVAGTMSGGEQKMLAVARGLMCSPRLLMVDEPSLGLAPQLTEAVFDALCDLNQRGISVVLAEQNVHKTLVITQRGYVMENGQIVLSGSSSSLAANQHVKKAYLGV